MTPGDFLLKFPSMILFVIAFGKPSDQETETIKFGVGDKLGSISKEEQTLTLSMCVCLYFYIYQGCNIWMQAIHNEIMDN